VGNERDEISEEEGIRVGYLSDEGLDEPVVRVEAARENDCQKIHSGLATVRALVGTGPK
jgi:hypothetical protein